MLAVQGQRFHCPDFTTNRDGAQELFCPYFYGSVVTGFIRTRDGALLLLGHLVPDLSALAVLSMCPFLGNLGVMHPHESALFLGFDGQL